MCGKLTPHITTVHTEPCEAVCGEEMAAGIKRNVSLVRLASFDINIPVGFLIH